MRRAISLLAILACAALGLAAPAAAQEGDDRRFTLRPSLQTRLVANDNIGLQDNGRDGDFGVWFTPRIEAGFRESAYEVGVDAAIDFRQYTNRSGFDETFYRVDAFGEVGLLPGLSLRVSDAYTPQPTALGLPDDDPANLVQTNQARLEMRYWREFAGRRELTGGLSGGRFDTDRFAAAVEGPGGTTVIDPGFRADFWEGAFFLEGRNPVGDQHGVYLRTDVRQRSFDDRGGADHLQAQALVGWQTDLEQGLALDIAGGWGWIDFQDGGSDSNSIARATLSLRRPNGWHIQLGARNEFTVDVAGNDFMDTTGRFRVEKYFGRRTAASVTAFASYLESDSNVRSSNWFAGGEASVRRQLSRRFQVSLNYRYWHNAGSFSGDDLVQNRAVLSLTYRH